MRSIFGLSLVLCILVVTGKPTIAGAQCYRSAGNLIGTDIEYLGRDSLDHHIWLGQRFAINCDAQFLTVRFRFYLSVVNFNGVPSLTIGDTLTCSLLDSNYETIATGEHILTIGYNYQWVEFDFGALNLGLAAGDLIAKITTPQAAFGYLATSGDTVPGELVIGYDEAIFTRENKDAVFAVTWDPTADVVAEKPRTWGVVKGMYR